MTITRCFPSRRSGNVAKHGPLGQPLIPIRWFGRRKAVDTPIRAPHTCEDSGRHVKMRAHKRLIDIRDLNR